MRKGGYYAIYWNSGFGAVEKNSREKGRALKEEIKSMTNGQNGFDIYMGNDCSGAVYNA